MSAPSLANFLAVYPALCDVPLHGLSMPTSPVHVPMQTTLFREGQLCQGFPLVLAGEVRVSRSTTHGRELELYRVVPGELCLVSAAALFGGETMLARGVTTAPSELLILPTADFRAAMAVEGFRDFVLGLYATRMADLTGLLEAVAFQRLDSRLAATLLGHGTQLHTTHQALADELGTVREIVTRLLHRFERAGWVSLSRECITIHNSTALRQLAAVAQRS